MSDAHQRQEASLDPELSSGRHSSGEMLKRERERQGLTIEEVAVQLNLRPAVVNGLEADQYNEVPVAAYRRGYLRAYARLMGIDEGPVVAAYNAQHGDTRSDVERRVTPVQHARKPSRVGAWIFKLFTLLVILGLIGLTLLWWQSRNGNDLLGLSGSREGNVAESMNDGPAGASGTDGQDAGMPPVADQDGELGLVASEGGAADAGASEPPLVEDPATSEDTATATAPDDTTQTPNPIIAETDNSSATGTARSDGSDTASQADSATPPAEQSATQTPAVNERQLSLTFNEQSWTAIYDANDRRILVGLQSAGTQATAEGDPPFRLTIGNATGVELNYRGEAVDLAARTGGNNVARFTLGE